MGYSDEAISGMAAIVDNNVEFLFDIDEDTLNDIDCQG
jgi:hypothetical protein